MGLLKNIVKQFLQSATIVEKEKFSETAFKIRIKADSFKSADFVAGYFLRLGIGLASNSLSIQDLVRSYSVWDIDRTNGTIDLAIATHSKGAGAKWVEQCQLNDTVYFAWKKGNFLVDDNADSYLMVGDLSALSHLYIIKRSLPKNKPVESILYSQAKSDLYADIDGTTPFYFYEMEHNAYQEIIDKVEKILPLNDR